MAKLVAMPATQAEARSCDVHRAHILAGFDLCCFFAILKKNRAEKECPDSFTRWCWVILARREREREKKNKWSLEAAGSFKVSLKKKYLPMRQLPSGVCRGGNVFALYLAFLKWCAAALPSVQCAFVFSFFFAWCHRKKKKISISSRFCAASWPF